MRVVDAAIQTDCGSFKDVAAPTQFDGVCDDETSALHDGCNMSTADIVEWVRTLPESRVPETSQENIISILQNNDMCGAKFTQYLQRVPPEVCPPKHAMTLKSAWNNVLAGVTARELAKVNSGSLPKQKSGMMIV